MRVITIGREFGSGGRELGKRLADALGIPCYDKEIIDEVAKAQGLSSEEVESISLSDIRRVYPFTIGRTLTASYYYNALAIEVIAKQYEVIKSLAEQGDCVIVGRQADLILQKQSPLNLFVYADEASKLKRCLARAEQGETEKKLRKEMKRVDKERAANRKAFGGSAWGRKENYHLCVNTSGTEIKELIPSLVAFVNAWFADKE